MVDKSPADERVPYSLKDHPFDEVAASAELWVKRGAKVFQKFTCELCGTRQGIMESNVFYETGKCEMCGHITNIRKRGCNFLLEIRNTPNVPFPA